MSPYLADSNSFGPPLLRALLPVIVLISNTIMSMERRSPEQVPDEVCLLSDTQGKAAADTCAPLEAHLSRRRREALTNGFIIVCDRRGRSAAA